MHLFDQDILFEPREAHSFAGRITENWSINGVPDGGYLMAILAKAMLHQSEMKSTPTITANYLNRCEPGAGAVTIERMSASRQFQRFQARLHQNGTEKIRAFGTFVSEKMECISTRRSCPAQWSSPVSSWVCQVTCRTVKCSLAGVGTPSHCVRIYPSNRTASSSP